MKCTDTILTNYISLFEHLYQGALPNQYVSIRDNSHGYMFQIKDILNKSSLETILNNFKNTDSMMTFNTFSHCKESTKKSGLWSIKAFCIDIDYHKKSNLKDLSPQQVLGLIELELFEGGLPIPNYIEYGHNIRFYYCLKESIHLSKKSRYVILPLLEKLVKSLTNILSEFTDDTQSLNSYFRLEGSINSKDNSQIKLIKTEIEDYELQFLLDEYLPYTKEEVDSFKSSSKKYKKCGYSGLNKSLPKRNIKTWNLNRLEDLETVQAELNQSKINTGYRELLCYWFKNYAILSGLNNKQATDKVILFNEHFNYPLLEKHLLSNINNISEKRTYLHKAITFKTLLEQFGLSDSFINSLQTTSSTITTEYKESYNKQYYQDKLNKNIKNNKQDELQYEHSLIQAMAKAGYKNFEIAIFLKCSESKVAKYLHKLGFLRKMFTKAQFILYRKQFLGALKSKQHKFHLNRNVKIPKHLTPKEKIAGYKSKLGKFITTGLQLCWCYLNDTEYALLETNDLDLMNEYIQHFQDDLKPYWL